MTTQHPLAFPLDYVRCLGGGRWETTEVVVYLHRYRWTWPEDGPDFFVVFRLADDCRLGSGDTKEEAVESAQYWLMAESRRLAEAAAVA